MWVSRLSGEGPSAVWAPSNWLGNWWKRTTEEGENALFGSSSLSWTPSPWSAHSRFFSFWLWDLYQWLLGGSWASGLGLQAMLLIFWALRFLGLSHHYQFLWLFSLQTIMLELLNLWSYEPIS
jgi:hypothetical protein